MPKRWTDWLNILKRATGEHPPTNRRDTARRLTQDNLGDVRPVGEGVSEIRIDYGSVYRVYITRRAEALVVLLAGGDKDS